MLVLSFPCMHRVCAYEDASLYERERASRAESPTDPEQQRAEKEDDESPRVSFLSPAKHRALVAANYQKKGVFVGKVEKSGPHTPRRRKIDNEGGHV